MTMTMMMMRMRMRMRMMTMMMMMMMMRMMMMTMMTMMMRMMRMMMKRRKNYFSSARAFSLICFSSFLFYSVFYSSAPSSIFSIHEPACTRRSWNGGSIIKIFELQEKKSTLNIQLCMKKKCHSKLTLQQ